jgi:hypothetical protein
VLLTALLLLTATLVLAALLVLAATLVLLATLLLTRPLILLLVLLLLVVELDRLAGLGLVPVPAQTLVAILTHCRDPPVQPQCCTGGKRQPTYH